MKHTTTGPLIREALRDEGVHCTERAPYLLVRLSPSTEMRLAAGNRDGRRHFDLPVQEAWGLYADEFETGSAKGAYCYASGLTMPRGSVEQEARALARSVNRTVRGTYGQARVTVVAAPVVAWASYVAACVPERLGGAQWSPRVLEVLGGAERGEGSVGVALLREETESGERDDLEQLKRAFDRLWSAYADEGEVTDAELDRYGVSPYMLRAARQAVHESWAR